MKILKNLDFIKKTPINFLKILLVLIIFGIIIKKSDIGYLLNILSNADFLPMVIAFILKVTGIIFSTLVLANSLKIFNSFIKITELFKVYFLSYFFNNLGLGSLGGDSYKFIRIKKVIGSTLKAGLSIVSEKIIGISILFSFFITSLLFLYFRNYFLYLIVIPIGYFIVQIFVYGFDFIINFLPLFVKKSGAKVEKIRKIRKIIDKSSRIKLSLSLIYSGLFYIVTIFAFSFIIYSIDKNIPLYVSFFIIPIVIFINTIPVSFQGLGIREISISYLFVFLGYPFEIGVSSALILLSINLFISLLSGVYYLISSLVKR